MAVVTLAQVVELTDQLTSEEQQVLYAHLQTRLGQPQHDVTLAVILEEFERRKAAGLFENPESLWGVFSNPELEALSYEALKAEIREFSTAWEQEIDEFGLLE